MTILVGRVCCRVLGIFSFFLLLDDDKIVEIYLMRLIIFCNSFVELYVSLFGNDELVICMFFFCFSEYIIYKLKFYLYLGYYEC